MNSLKINSISKDQASVILAALVSYKWAHQADLNRAYDNLEEDRCKNLKQEIAEIQDAIAAIKELCFS